ncbi:MAG: hypothetical protein SGCHY_003386 [Lobulomycetales sp.]
MQVKVSASGQTEAKGVCVAGDFNGWAADQLKCEKTADGWSATLPVAASASDAQTVRFKFVVPDTGLWFTSSRYPCEPDDLGNLNNVLPIPAAAKGTSLMSSVKSDGLMSKFKSDGMKSSVKSDGMMSSVKSAAAKKPSISLPLGLPDAKLDFSKTVLDDSLEKDFALDASSKKFAMGTSAKKLAMGTSEKTAAMGTSAKKLALDASGKTAAMGSSAKKLASDASENMGTSAKKLAMGTSEKTAAMGTSAKKLALDASGKTAAMGTSAKKLASDASENMGTSAKKLAMGTSEKTAAMGTSAKKLAMGTSDKTAAMGKSAKKVALDASAKTAAMGKSAKDSFIAAGTTAASTMQATKAVPSTVDLAPATEKAEEKQMLSGSKRQSFLATLKKRKSTLLRDTNVAAAANTAAAVAPAAEAPEKKDLKHFWRKNTKKTKALKIFFAKLLLSPALRRLSRSASTLLAPQISPRRCYSGKMGAETSKDGSKELTANSSVSKVIASVERIAPLAFAESWDNVGLLVEAPKPRQGAEAVFLTIDLTSWVLREAIQNPKIGYIVAYHPPLFRKINRICLDDAKPAIAAHCIAYGISVYSPHTSFDRCANGINDWLARGLGEGSTRYISPLPSGLRDIPGQETAGNGRIHTLATPTSLSSIVKRLKKHLGVPSLRVASAGEGDVEITRIAICAGSGSSLLSPVDNVDMYLSGEMGHHDVLDALERGISVVLSEHSNSERGFLAEVVKPMLEEDGLEVFVSKLDKDPLVAS